METLERKHNVTRPPEVEGLEWDSLRPFPMKGIMEADGTRYTALVIPVMDFGLQMLGNVDEGYLVISGLTRKAYLLHRRGWLDPNYIHEKFGGTITDAENFCILLDEMLPLQKLPGYLKKWRGKQPDP